MGPVPFFAIGRLCASALDPGQGVLDPRLRPRRPGHREQLEALIDEEVRQLVQTAYEKALGILTMHRSSLQKIAELLLNKEIIYKKDLEEVLGSRE